MQCSAVQCSAGCILEVHVQDAKGVGVIRGCKGATFQVNFSLNIIEHLKWSQGQHFVWAVDNDRKPTSFLFIWIPPPSYQNAYNSVTLLKMENIQG